MANTSPGFLTSSELDFNSLKQSLKLFMSQQTLFKDWNFDGSNISVMLDLLTYNTTMKALYLNLVGSEMFLDSAQLRESIISHAKELNYSPLSRSSAFVTLQVQLSGNNIPGVVPLSTGFAISGTGANGSSLAFITDSPVLLTSENNWAANVDFYEGRLITETFISNFQTGNSVIFNLQSANVDTTSISVSVQNSVSDLTTTTWNYSPGFSGVTSNSNVWFLQGYKDNYYQVVFGNGRFGASLLPGNIVTVTYRETSGVGGNGITTFSPMSNTGLVGVAISLTSAANSMSIGGSERESNNSIVFSAPRYFQTQGKAITAPDYKELIQTHFPQFQTVAAYGGEDAVPQKQYGTVLVSGKIDGIDFIPNNLADAMIDFLQPIVPLGLTVKVVQPDVYKVNLDCSVSYNPLKTTLTSTEIQFAIVDSILQYDSSTLEVFGASFYGSPLGTQIKNVDPSVISVNLKSSIVKEFIPVVGAPSSYSFNYQNALYYPFSSATLYPPTFEPVLLSSIFYYTANTQAIIQDNGLGSLNIVLASNAEVVLTSAVGSVNYVTGQVSISPFIISAMPSNTNVLSFTAQLPSPDVNAASNQILSIDPENITVDVKAKNVN